jgi:cysteine desulfurase NifS/selenium donor protein
MEPIYLDYNATTPIDPAVAEAMRPFLMDRFGNPSSSHRYGVLAKKAVEAARRQVAEAVGASPEEIVFTSGGTESNNYAIKGVAFANREKGNHIITSTVEHPAVSEVCDYLQKHGFRTTRVPVDSRGLVDPVDVEKAITPSTILVTVMHANNEVGTIQPIHEIGEIARRHGVLMHTDAAQSMGKIPVDVDDLNVDLLSIAGHKLYAPKGIGALYIRTGTVLEKLIHGADHERNQRAGTENVLEIVGLGRACELAAQDIEQRAVQMKKLRDRLHEGLSAVFGELRLNGHPEKRLPNTLSLCFKGLEADAILSELTEVAASAGAACHSDTIDLSATLEAMKVPMEYAMGTIRFSTGIFTTEEEVDRAVEIISDTVGRLRPSEVEAKITVSDEEIKLTRFTTGLGCACKLRPQALERILAKIPLRPDPKVMVGTETADDAAVYRLSDEIAVVQSVDFFTPVVDDPYWFGAIAAANSLSDIYAMGAKPIFALSIVAFPSNRLPMSVLEAILKGSWDVADRAGISIIGGHTIDDNEPKFGLAVTGVVHPDKILTNKAARPGDALVLTKPLGLGIMTTALKRGMLDEKTETLIQSIMAELNAAPAEVMREFPVSACTDVTGFGLLGHLKELAAGSNVDVEIDHRALPVIKGAADLATGGTVPGGTLNNMEFVSDIVRWEKAVSQTSRILACDAQTSGGLLISLPADRAGSLVGALHAAGVTDAVRIGEIKSEGTGMIHVT